MPLLIWDKTGASVDARIQRFCAGDDVPQLRSLTPPEAQTWARVRREAVDAVAAIPKP